MAATPMNFYRGHVPPERTVVYTVPEGQQAIVTNIVSTNDHASAASLAVWFDGFPILANVGIASKGVLTVEMNQVLQAGETIEVQGNAYAAATHISGVEVV
ncbi:hypothetical protein [Streptomyces sp. NPDC006879]|uniref:hypothetical protein n=1 Tax=Streptomyces sp. NPDC006879 TaxID=3364767 RepID=UPI0036B0D7FF